jgi:hypothetical protein
MKQSFNTDDTVILKDEQLKFAHIDCDIIFGNDIADFTTQGAVVKPAPFGTSVCDSNEEPLLVNQVNHWSLRPQSYTDLPNLFSCFRLRKNLYRSRNHGRRKRGSAKSGE